MRTFAQEWANLDPGDDAFGQQAVAQIPWSHTRVLPRELDGHRSRVLLSDGGLFDNLGTSCLEPGRSPEHSYDVYEVDIIIACDAGRGLPEDSFPVNAPGGLARSFDLTYRCVATYW